MRSDGDQTLIGRMPLGWLPAGTTPTPPARSRLIDHDLPARSRRNLPRSAMTSVPVGLEDRNIR